MHLKISRLVLTAAWVVLIGYVVYLLLAFGYLLVMYWLSLNTTTAS